MQSYNLVLLILALLLTACNKNPSIIEIRSTPSGANVTEAVKGKLGTTPIHISFSQHECQDSDGPCVASFYFTKPGYADERVERLVDSEQVMVHAYLQPIESKLHVKGFPDFATVDVKYQRDDGRWSKLSLTGKVGNTPSLTEDTPWQGKSYCNIRLIIESPGYIPETKNITIYKGEQKQFEYVLQEYAIVGEILSEPTGADIYEKSLGYLGRTPFKLRIPYDQLMRISPQRRQKLDEPVYLFLQAKKPGYQSTDKIAAVGEINESEKPAPFFIAIKLSSVNKK